MFRRIVSISVSGELFRIARFSHVAAMATDGAAASTVVEDAEDDVGQVAQEGGGEWEEGVSWHSGIHGCGVGSWSSWRGGTSSARDDQQHHTADLRRPGRARQNCTQKDCTSGRARVCEDELLLQRRAREEQEPKEEEDEQDFVMKLMPCKGLVMPIGHHVGEASTSLVVEALRQVLALRREKLEKLDQDADPRILPLQPRRRSIIAYLYFQPQPQLPLHQRRAISQA